MRQPARTTRRLSTAVGVVLATAMLAACSGQEPDGTDLVAEAQEVQLRNNQAQQQAIDKRAAELPIRPAGTVVVDGDTDRSLTARLRSDFIRNGTSTSITLDTNGEDRAFQRLCAGEVDLVDSSREITRAEWDACHDVGLDVVQFQLAADAVVVAIKSESDVGGDCLSTQQVQDIYRAGSPVTNWNQVGLDDVPLRVAGPEFGNQGFDFVGRHVLDAPEPSMVNFRSDYQARDSDQGSRTFVVGNPRDEELAALNGDRQRIREELKSQLTEQWQVVGDKLDEVEVAQAEVEKGIRDQRPAATQASDQARLDRAKADHLKAKQRLARIRDRWEASQAAAETSAGALRRYDATRGHVSFFRFSYYELFEEQLRPFEITLPDGERNCVFPSQRTIVSGQYPLAERLLITTTTRALEREDVSGLLEFYLEHAVEAADEERLVSIPEAGVAQQLAVVRGEESPTLVLPEDETPAEAAEPTPTDEPAL